MKKQTAKNLGTYLSLSVGAGMLGGATAEASVITYSGPAITAGVGQQIWWDPISMTAGLGSSANAVVKYRGANYIYTVKPGNPYMAVATMSAGSKNLNRLLSGATIDSSLNWFANTWAYMNKSGWTTANDPWATGQNGTTGCVGFRFRTTTPDYCYGWLSFTYNNGDLHTLQLNGFAYESTPNMAIGAGGLIPEPSSLGLLALGATGLIASRRLRKAA